VLRQLSLAAAVALGVLGTAGTAAAAPSGPCTDPAGVTVVVDATTLGGEVSVGCATAPTSGTDALEKAGFTDTRDAASMICAIDQQPDPCPATFDGQYWSYWFVKDGQWQTYMEGSDTAKPAAGAIEGWRWADGSTPPAADPATLLAAAASPSASESPSATPSESAAADSSASPTDEASATLLTADQPADSDSGTSPVVWVVVGVVVVVVAAVVVVVLRRRRAA